MICARPEGKTVSYPSAVASETHQSRSTMSLIASFLGSRAVSMEFPRSDMSSSGDPIILSDGESAKVMCANHNGSSGPHIAVSVGDHKVGTLAKGHGRRTFQIRDAASEGPAVRRVPPHVCQPRDWRSAVKLRQPP